MEDKLFKENGKQYLVRPAISRDDIILEAIDKCLDLMFRASYPSITLEEYKQQHENLKPEEKEEAQLFNAHYLPMHIYHTIEEDFIEAYELRSDLPKIIDILKGYFKEPLVDTWVRDDEGYSRRKSVEHPDPMPEEHRVVVEKYLDMANSFFKWDSDLNTFAYNIMNFAPCSNRETVEKWWHEHGDPDFKLPDDSFWTDTWEDDKKEE